MARTKVRKKYVYSNVTHLVVKKSPKKSGRKGGPKATDPDDDKRDDLLQKSDMNNQKFEAYYSKQLAMHDDEWSTFLDACREPLPSTFRICGTRECVCLHSLSTRVPG
jgi:hypothetical protein